MPKPEQLPLPLEPSCEFCMHMQRHARQLGELLDRAQAEIEALNAHVARLERQLAESRTLHGLNFLAAA